MFKSSLEIPHTRDLDNVNTSVHLKHFFVKLVKSTTSYGLPRWAFSKQSYAQHLFRKI